MEFLEGLRFDHIKVLKVRVHLTKMLSYLNAQRIAAMYQEGIGYVVFLIHAIPLASMVVCVLMCLFLAGQAPFGVFSKYSVNDSAHLKMPAYYPDFTCLLLPLSVRRNHCLNKVRKVIIVFRQWTSKKVWHKTFVSILFLQMQQDKPESFP